MLRLFWVLLKSVFGFPADLLFGLVVVSIGAVAGSVWLSTVVIGWHVYSSPYTDPQYASFALMATIPFGAFFGAIAAGLKFVLLCRGGRIASAVIRVSDGLFSTMGGAGLLLILVHSPGGCLEPISITWTDTPADFVGASVTAVSLIVWGLSRLVPLSRVASLLRALDH